MRLLLISSSNVHGYGYLDHAEPDIKRFLGSIRRVAFIPYAANDHAGYTANVRERLGRMGFDVLPVERLDEGEAIFVGGGNTFRLLKALYDHKLIDVLRDKAKTGVPYIGSSAGSVITSPTIRTTNDMPAVEPPTLTSLGLIPFQLNCHYLDIDPTSTHKGETREERIRDYHEDNDYPVVGLREGTMLEVEGDAVTLLGLKSARIFKKGDEPFEVPVGTRIDEAVR